MARESYEKQTWENLPSETTPLSAERLAHIEEGIESAHNNRALKEIYSDNTVNLGRKSDTTVGNYSATIGFNLEASGVCAYARGSSTKATGNNAISDGMSTEASGENSHASGTYTEASGVNSCSIGRETEASGDNSLAGGKWTIASHENQVAIGKSNEEVDAPFVIGGGTSYTDRKNIHTVDWNGNAKFAGTVTDGNGNSIQPEENIDIDFSTYFS